MSDRVAVWEIALADGRHVLEFEHGTTTGKRVVIVDGKEIMRKEWMFKLVGSETFNVGKVKCTISIEAVSGFAYEYVLTINGKTLKKFAENQRKISKSWVIHDLDGHPIRVALEKDTMDVYVNGKRMETTGEFVDDGTETSFAIAHGHSAFIKATTTGKKKDGIIHDLFVDDTRIEPEPDPWADYR